MHGGFEIVLWVLFALATVTDLVWGKIHNLLTFTFLASGVVVRLFVGGTPSGATALLAIGAAFALFFPLYVIKAMAAGDVKLLMAAGAWTDYHFVFQMGLLTIVIGAAVGLVVKIRAGGFRFGLTRMPFAPAFLCALFILKISEIKGWVLF